MILSGFYLMLFLTDWVQAEDSCSYQDVLSYLNVSKNNECFFLTRPARDYRRPTMVSLEVLLYAILDVVEKDQKFIPYVWTVTQRWNNEYISWDPNQFCGIDNVSLPAEILWKPDITIEEMTEIDKAPPHPYLTINNKGDVEFHNDQVLVSTCRMYIYNFPFDIQSCNLSFKSAIHTAKDMRLQPSDNSSEATEDSREVMRTQYEWLFISLKVTTINASNPFDQDIIIYTINMKRRSALYIVNFILPVLFILCLDLGSFLISDSGGEKLSFKVTVLLAITVLQLILNEILPASSNRIPLIAVYCMGIFALMMLSLLETIVVMYLIEKDSVFEDNETFKDQREDKRSNEVARVRDEDCKKRGRDNLGNCHRDVHKWTQCACIYDGVGNTSCELLSMAKENNCSSSKEELLLVDEYSVLAKVSDDLREVEKKLSLLLSSRREEFKPGYWTRVAKRVNRVFIISYLTVVSVFLVFLFLEWTRS